MQLVERKRAVCSGVISEVLGSKLNCVGVEGTDESRCMAGLIGL